MVSSQNLVFDPFQLKEFGADLYQTENFSIRFYTSKKFLFKSIYVPYGPVITNESGIQEFIEFLKNQKFSKIKIDLPVILDHKFKEKISNELKGAGFKQTEYLLDNETLLLTKNNWELNDRNMRYVRSGLKQCEISVREEINATELKAMYDLYTNAANSLNYKPKNFEAFSKIAESSITSIAINKNSNNIEGFLMGYKNQIIVNHPELKDLPQNSKSLQLIFTGLSEEGKNVKLGFALHHALFTECFENKNIDLIDFHGASRNQARSYVGFKQMFGGQFISNPGSFTKINII